MRNGEEKLKILVLGSVNVDVRERMDEMKRKEKKVKE